MIYWEFKIYIACKAPPRYVGAGVLDNSCAPKNESYKTFEADQGNAATLRKSNFFFHPLKNGFIYLVKLLDLFPMELYPLSIYTHGIAITTVKEINVKTIFLWAPDI